jgi:hypothetical protein
MRVYEVEIVLKPFTFALCIAIISEMTTPISANAPTTAIMYNIVLGI